MNDQTMHTPTPRQPQQGTVPDKHPASVAHSSDVWDEPSGAASPRGWYWPKASTKPGHTACAGHYLDYGPNHLRFDEQKLTQPGSIHCVVIAKDTRTAVRSRYVETVEKARTWIEEEAAKFGHLA